MFGLRALPRAGSGLRQRGRCAHGRPMSAAAVFGLSEEQLELQAVARAYAQRELPALAAELEATNTPVPESWRKKWGC
jgi:hypothetical protein